MSRWSYRNFVNFDQDKKMPTREAFRNNWFILKLVWSIQPFRVIGEFLLQILRQLSRVFYSIVFIRFLLDGMQHGVEFSNIVALIGLMLFIYFIVNSYSMWYEIKFKPISDTILYEHLYQKLFTKANEVELECYEDPEFYNTYTTAIQEADIRVNEVLTNMASVISATLATISVFTVMFSIDKLVILFALFPIIGNFVLGKIVNQFIYKRHMDTVPFRRRMDYVDRVAYLSQYAKEVRLSNVFTVLRTVYNEGYKGVLKVAKQYQNGLIKYDFFRNALAFTMLFEGVLLYGAYKAMIAQTISISDFGVLATAMVSGAWMLIEMAERFVKIYENAIFIKNLQYFMEYEPTLKNNDNAMLLNKSFNELVFNQVGFSYSGADKISVSQLNLTISRKSKIALVGHNGAGKTTFTKLLMRLYDPTEGEILIDGQNIKHIEVDSFRSQFATAFQDFQIFAMTIAENVLMKEIETDEEEQRVITALQKSGVYEKVSSLPFGIHTVLTREFDDNGVNLSGGELQKIAIARVFARQSDVVILDEPTSALDPIAEYTLYQNIIEQCAEQTVIFISHRLSSAAIADHIYLFEDGKIAEHGTHQQLMKQQGKYSEMFLKQAEKYIENDELTAAYTFQPLIRGV